MRFLKILFTQEWKFLMSQRPSSQFLSLGICGIARMALDEKPLNLFVWNWVNGLKLAQNPAYL